jgi:hypothetical protein
MTIDGTGPSNAIVAAGESVWLGVSKADVSKAQYVSRWAGWSGQNRQKNLSNGLFIEDQAQTSAQITLPGTRTRALPSRPRPWFGGMALTDGMASTHSMCNAVTDCGVLGDNSTDSTKGLQACVRRCAGIFLPSGIYLLTDTLLLNKSTVLVGEALSQLYLGQSSPGFGDAAAPKVVVDTPNDAGGEVMITDVSIQAGWDNQGAVLLRWQVGEASGLWDVHINISHNIHIGMHVTGAGAGVISNMWG